jgi:hypothetical protein
MEEDIISSYIVTSLVECGHKCLECKDCVTFSHRITQNYGINCKVSGPTSELIVKNQLGDDEIWTTYRIIEPVSHTNEFGICNCPRRAHNMLFRPVH